MNSHIYNQLWNHDLSLMIKLILFMEFQPISIVLISHRKFKYNFDNQFTFKRLELFGNRLINFTVNANNMESSFYLTLPPIINDIINNDNKTLNCGSIITTSGKNLITGDEEFKVTVLINENTTIVVQDQKQ
ncbi:hypothetical protein ACTA71_009294 [Dictyostelium dimigraforme]